MADTFHPNWVPGQLNAEHVHEHTLLAEVGDLLYWDSADDTLKPASSFADAGTAAATQAAFAALFAGVSNSKQQAADTTSRNARAIVDGIFEFPCASSTFAVGDYVAPAYSGGALLDQQLTRTTNPALAIGRVVKRYASATTRVKVRLTSALLMGLLRVYGTPVVGAQAGVLDGWFDLALTAWREVDANGDVGNVVANGGVLASDTTPILLGDAAEAMAIQWAAGNADPVAVGVSLPPDLDDTADVLLDLLVVSAGTTNAPSFTVESSWDGAAKVSDSAAGTAVNTKQTITATIAAADVPAGAVALTVGLTPGAHATDAWTLYAARVRYKRKLLTA